MFHPYALTNSSCASVVKPVCSAGKLYFVDRPGQTQANIALGEVGIDMVDPDAFALDVLGDIMNGFGGRLFDELRSREVLLIGPLYISL